MTKGLKRKFLTMVIDALKTKAYFFGVYGQVPKDPLPAAGQTPAVFVYWTPSDLEYLTTHEKRGLLRFSALGYVHSNENVELIKADCLDEMEEALENMLNDSNFLAIAVQVNLTRVDPGPLALVELGHQAGVFPPWGAVRLDGHVEFDYTARS